MDNANDHSPPGESANQALSDEERLASIDAILPTLSASQLDTVISKAQQAKQERRAADQKEFEASVAPLKEKAKQYGYVLILQPETAGRERAHKAKPAAGPQASVKSINYPPGVYICPKTGVRWSPGPGRGRPPAEITRLVRAGHDPSEFLEKAGEHAEDRAQTAENERQTASEKP